VEQTLSSGLAAPALDKDVEHAPVLVDRAGAGVHADNLHYNFVQVPFVAGTSQPTPDLVGERLTELQPSLAYEFMADDDTASGADLVEVPQAE
jgi:hypothetical protein